MRAFISSTPCAYIRTVGIDDGLWLGEFVGTCVGESVIGTQSADEVLLGG